MVGDKFWRLIERSGLLIGTVCAVVTAYFTVGLYFGWNVPSLPPKPSGAVMTAPWWLYGIGIIAIALLLTAWAMIAIRSRKKGYSLTDLELVENRTFRNEVVLISGRQFNGCRFENVTLLYNGGGTGFDRCGFAGFHLKSEIPEVNGMIAILNNLGFLKFQFLIKVVLNLHLIQCLQNYCQEAHVKHFLKFPPMPRHPIPGPQGRPERTSPGMCPVSAYS